MGSIHQYGISQFGTHFLPEKNSWLSPENHALRALANILSFSVRGFSNRCPALKIQLQKWHYLFIIQDIRIC